jgi:hypothetical protein
MTCPGPPRVRIVSWNVGQRGLAKTLEAASPSRDLAGLLLALRADVLCLQEVKNTRAELREAQLLAPGYTETLATWAIGLTTVALVVRAAMLARNARLRPKSTVQSAIGVKHPKVQQKSQGAMGGSFNTREFNHGRTRAFLRSIKWAFLLLAFPLPAALLWLGAMSGAVAVLALAFAVQYVGLLAERWFFFAQANHPQNLYYQTIS